MKPGSKNGGNSAVFKKNGPCVTGPNIGSQNGSVVGSQLVLTCTSAGSNERLNCQLVNWMAPVISTGTTNTVEPGDGGGVGRESAGLTEMIGSAPTPSE